MLRKYKVNHLPNGTAIALGPVDTIYEAESFAIEDGAIVFYRTGRLGITHKYAVVARGEWTSIKTIEDPDGGIA